MKKLTLFTLALLIFAGSMQTGMAMDNAEDNPGAEGIARQQGEQPQDEFEENENGNNQMPAQEGPRVVLDLQALQNLPNNQRALAANQQILRANHDILRRDFDNFRENNTVYKRHTALAKNSGRFHGALAGFIWGIGCGGALATLTGIKQNDRTNSMALIGLLAAGGLYGAFKKTYYASIREENRLTIVQKNNLKRKYHEEEFKANTLTSTVTTIGTAAAAIALVSVSLSAGLKGVYSDVKPQEISSTSTSLWNMVPHTVLGIAGLKWLTYTGMRSYKKWMRPPQAQAPR